MTTNEKLQECWKVYRDNFDDSITFSWYKRMTEGEFEYKDNDTEAETYEEYVDELYEMYSTGEF